MCDCCCNFLLSHTLPLSLPLSPSHTHTHTDTLTLYFTGEASVTAYESLLLSLTYTNLATEPTPGNRYINITLFDGLHRDITAVIVIVVLTNDNPLTIETELEEDCFTFTEGEVVLSVGIEGGVRLVDLDRDPMIVSLLVRLDGALEPGREDLVVDLSSLGGGIERGVEVFVNQTESLENYQVHDALVYCVISMKCVFSVCYNALHIVVCIACIHTYSMYSYSSNILYSGWVACTVSICHINMYTHTHTHTHPPITSTVCTSISTLCLHHLR